jgi:hypothetical protein
MPISCSIGQGQAFDGVEASRQAAIQALRTAGGASPPALAWIIASSEYKIDQVLLGAASALGEIPCIGFSTSVGLTSDGLAPRSVIIGLISGDGLKAQAEWQPDFVEDSAAALKRLSESLNLETAGRGTLFLCCDGFAAVTRKAYEPFWHSKHRIHGCLAWGNLNVGKTFQMGGKSGGSAGAAAGASGVAGALLNGKIKTSAGVSLGWQPVGAVARVTRTKGMWVRELDGHKASETFARLFGHTPRDWVIPPLSQLVRLYPLGFEGEAGNLQVHAPLRVEADGSLRMNTIVNEGHLAHILVGSIENCLSAARQAAEQALEALGGAPPALALLFVDSAWQTLFDETPGAEVTAVRSVLGENVPIIGGYTYGQIYQPSPGIPLELLNQHIQVILFG